MVDFQNTIKAILISTRKRGYMNIKNKLKKAGFVDHTALTDAWGDELEFELCANLPRTQHGMGNIRIRKLNTQSDFELVVMDGDGFEIITTMLTEEEV